MKPAGVVRAIGRTTIRNIACLGHYGLFLLTSLFWLFTSPLKIRRIIEQISFIGVKSTIIVLLTGAFTGMVLALQAFYALNKFGGESLLGPTVALALIRELGPVVSALMVTGRAGSALASEIGIMRITEQIDAMEIMAVNPYRYIIVPNIVAAIIAFPVLGAFFSLIGIWGGYVVGVEILGLSAGTYFGEMTNYLDMQDIRMGIYKSLSFGLIVSWICCYKGYFTSYGAKGVGNATTQAVVVSSVLILIWDYFVTSIFV
ncbi:MAG: MlaE family lipid ABC transporter permease subunit [Desulfobacterota bacterium]|nr:MlaE family lipid ABC transporter permease subunit [Thermodesulfobacteriota bacterium]